MKFSKLFKMFRLKIEIAFRFDGSRQKNEDKNLIAQTQDTKLGEKHIIKRKFATRANLKEPKWALRQGIRNLTGKNIYKNCVQLRKELNF